MKFLICLVSFFSSIIGDDGWFPVEAVEVAHSEENWSDQDQTIWPVFAKKMGSEHILVRFPGDPDYRYLSNVEIEIFAEHGEERHSLRILDRSDSEIIEERINHMGIKPDSFVVDIQRTSSEMADLQYFSQGKWVAERLLLSPERLYIFQTSSAEPLTGNHRQFIASFAVETR